MPRLRANISSDSLFHFIRRREWLFDILRNKSFKAFYVYEDIPEIKYKVGIPMKCFCDIPLGLIKKQINKYGKFGIGISKVYAKKNHISPIIYIHKTSDTLVRYLDSLNSPDLFKNKKSLLPYFKIDERQTKLPKGNKYLVERFYDEREWRFIPKNPEFIDFSGFDEEEIRSTRLGFENKKLIIDNLRYNLPFSYSDLTYLFVQKTSDVDNVIDEIRNLNLNQRTQDRLIAKIITARQIERDF